MKSGNISKAKHGCRSPEKSFLFLLTNSIALEADYPEIGQSVRQRQLLLDCFGALLLPLETLVACLICTPVRTHYRIRSPRLAASSR